MRTSGYWTGEVFRTWAFPLGIALLWLFWLLGVLLHGDGVNLIENIGFAAPSYEVAGQFGDAFGALSSFMAALAAAGAWRAVSLSRNQAFETTFYNLLAHLNQLIAGTDIQSSRLIDNAKGKKQRENTTLHEGRDAFKRMVRSLRSSIAASRGDELERVVRGYRRFHDRHKNDLAHYFRTIYHIMLFIDGAPVTNKARYAKILRAQLSDSEQVLLMYNCSVGRGRLKFKRLVEEYSLLHNCSKNEDENHWEMTLLRPSFASSAFRDNDAEDWPSADDLRSDLEGFALVEDAGRLR